MKIERIIVISQTWAEVEQNDSINFALNNHLISLVKHWHHHHIEHTQITYTTHTNWSRNRNSNSNSNVITISSHRHIFHIQFVYLFTYNKSISLIFVMPISQFGSYDEMHWVRNGMMFEKTWQLKLLFFFHSTESSYSHKIWKNINTCFSNCASKNKLQYKNIQLTDH